MAETTSIPTSKRPTGKQWVPEWVSNRNKLLRKVDPDEEPLARIPRRGRKAPPPEVEEISDDDMAWNAYGIAKEEHTPTRSVNDESAHSSDVDVETDESSDGDRNSDSDCVSIASSSSRWQTSSRSLSGIEEVNGFEDDVEEEDDLYENDLEYNGEDEHEGDNRHETSENTDFYEEEDYQSPSTPHDDHEGDFQSPDSNPKEFLFSKLKEQFHAAAVPPPTSVDTHSQSQSHTHTQTYHTEDTEVDPTSHEEKTSMEDYTASVATADDYEQAQALSQSQSTAQDSKEEPYPPQPSVVSSAQASSSTDDSYWGNPVRTINPHFLRRNQEGIEDPLLLRQVRKSAPNGGVTNISEDPPTGATDSEGSDNETKDNDIYTADSIRSNWGPNQKSSVDDDDALSVVVETIQETMRRLTENVDNNVAACISVTTNDDSETTTRTGSITTGKKRSSSRIDFAGRTNNESTAIRKYYGIGKAASDRDEKMRCRYMPTTAPQLKQADDEGFDWIPRPPSLRDPPPQDVRYEDFEGDSDEDIEVGMSTAAGTEDYSYSIGIETATNKNTIASTKDSRRSSKDSRRSSKDSRRSSKDSRRSSKDTSRLPPRHVFAPLPPKRTRTNNPPRATDLPNAIEYCKPPSRHRPNHCIHFAICCLMILIPGLTFTLVYYLLGFELR